MALRIVRLLTLLLLLGLLTLGGYWWYSESGLYLWLAELQIRVFGWYVPLATGLFTLLLPSMPLLAPLIIIAKLLEGKKSAEELRRRQTRTELWLRENRYSLGAFIVGLVFCGFGLYFFLTGWTAGDRTPLSLADLEAGQAPQSLWVVVQGTPLLQKALVERSSGRGLPIDTYYLPMVSDRWKPGRPVALFASCPDAKFKQLQALKGNLEGLLSPRLPGPVRTRFEQQGFVPADRHYLLEFDKLPALTKEIGLVFLGLGAALIILAVTIWIVKTWKARREPDFESME